VNFTGTSPSIFTKLSMATAKKPLKLGILVPSSNTALEPLTYQMTSSLSPPISVHFSRLPVTKISLDPSALSQFDPTGPIHSAARLLADAKVDVIGWSGTSGGWMGPESEAALCRSMSEARGVVDANAATTSTLGLFAALRGLGATKIGLVTPYLDDVQERIIKVFQENGFEVVAESHLRITENLKIAEIGEDALTGQVEEVIREGRGQVQAVTTFCTNLVAAHLVDGWEKKYGVPVLDSVSTVVWHMLKLKQYDTTAIKGWGKLFEL
jgi:maleate isomerase